MINDQVSLLLCGLKHTLCLKIASLGRMQNSLGHHCIIGMAGCLSYVSPVLAITILLVFQPFFSMALLSKTHLNLKLNQ